LVQEADRKGYGYFINKVMQPDFSDILSKAVGSAERERVAGAGAGVGAGAGSADFQKSPGAGAFR
jgi:hypothetical protein